MDTFYIKGSVMNAPGLAIGTDKTTMKVSKPIRVKANGIISLVKTTSDCPALEDSLGFNKAPSTNLPTGFYRIYTLLAAVDAVTGLISYSFVHSDNIDFNTMAHSNWVNQGNAGDEEKAIIGYGIVFNASGADFVPGTTDLDAVGIELQTIDQFGFIGM